MFLGFLCARSSGGSPTLCGIKGFAQCASGRRAPGVWELSMLPPSQDLLLEYALHAQNHTGALAGFPRPFPASIHLYPSLVCTDPQTPGIPAFLGYLLPTNSTDTTSTTTTIKINLGRRGFISAYNYTPSLIGVRTGTQGRDLEVETEAESMEEACSS